MNVDSYINLLSFETNFVSSCVMVGYVGGKGEVETIEAADLLP